MSFKYEDFFYVAQELAGIAPSKNSFEEAKLRSAISRAYYAVFLKAREYLELNTPVILPGDGSEHGLVKEQFFLRDRTDGKFRRIWESLDFLHKFRKKADYGETINSITNVITDALRRAEDALKRLSSLR